MAASYGPKPTLVLSEPVVKRGSEVADSSVMTSAEDCSDLDEETGRNRTSGRTLRLITRRPWESEERSESAAQRFWRASPSILGFRCPD
jgi:hypothetical protein